MTNGADETIFSNFMPSKPSEARQSDLGVLKLPVEETKMSISDVLVSVATTWRTTAGRRRVTSNNEHTSTRTYRERKCNGIDWTQQLNTGGGHRDCVALRRPATWVLLGTVKEVFGTLLLRTLGSLGPTDATHAGSRVPLVCLGS